MKEPFETTPLEISNTIPRKLSNTIEQKWQYCIIIERQIREATLAQKIPIFGKKEIKQVVESYKGRFAPKYQAFNILNNKLEEVVTQSR